MRKTITSTISVILALVFIFCLASCADKRDNKDLWLDATHTEDKEFGGNTTDTENKETPDTGEDGDNTADNENKEVGNDAIHTDDKEIGEGSKTITVIVEAQGKSVTFTIHTDKNTVGDALSEYGLLEGEEGPYGLYVKKVNGILADYDVDQTYWAFYINDDYAMTGVDVTDLIDGGVYKLVLEKG